MPENFGKKGESQKEILVLRPLLTQAKFEF